MKLNFMTMSRTARTSCTTVHLNNNNAAKFLNNFNWNLSIIYYFVTQNQIMCHDTLTQHTSLTGVRQTNGLQNMQHVK